MQIVGHRAARGCLKFQSLYARKTEIGVQGYQVGQEMRGQYFEVKEHSNITLRQNVITEIKNLIMCLLANYTQQKRG